jgi:hypothetical protein
MRSPVIPLAQAGQARKIAAATVSVRLGGHAGGGWARKGGPSMDRIKAFNPPKIGDDEHHIIRRLGWAVVQQWASLPEKVQGRVLEQAVFTADDYATVQLQQQIEIFIEKHAAQQP